MVEHFTKDEHYTSLKREVFNTTEEREELFEEQIKVLLNKVIKEPSSETVINILNFSRSYSK